MAQPTLVKKLFQTPNGPVMRYVDPSTGQVVQNTQGYQITDPQIADLQTLGLMPGSDKTAKDQLTQTTKEVAEQPSADRATNTRYSLPSITAGGERNGGFAGTNSNRDQGNNYGYIDKPGWMGMTSALPGTLGLAGKAVNAAVNASNVGAVNAARDAMDVDPLTGREAVSGVAKDRQGFVGNVDIQNQAGQTNSYSVGLEAMTPSGKTTLTPAEARARSFANPQNISLTEEQNESRKGGFVSKFRSFMDDLFSDDDVETKDVAGMTVAKEKTGGKFDKFPDAPKGFNSVNSSKGRGLGDLSDRARSDVEKGSGGLY